MTENNEIKPIEVLTEQNLDSHKFQLNDMSPLQLPVVKLNKKELNVVFNQGMEDFLKNNKSVNDCPYLEDDTQRVEAWREGFKYSVEAFSEKFAEYCVKEIIMQRKNNQVVKEE